MTTLYDRNESNRTAYINEVKIGGYVSNIGTMKQGKTKVIFFTTSDDSSCRCDNENTTKRIFTYNIGTKKIQELPSYD
jgi:hypothetical protein